MRSNPPRITALPLPALEQLAAAYGDRGMAHRSRTYTNLCDEAVAHIFAFHGGQEFDPQSGYHNLAEAGAALIQLLMNVYKEVESKDDRPTPVRVNPDEVVEGLGISRPTRVLTFPAAPDTP